MNKIKWSVVILVFSLYAGCSSSSDQLLRTNSINSRYFTDGSGKAIYLTGSHTWDNLLDMMEEGGRDTFDYDDYLNFLAAYEHNFFRLWTWNLVNWNTNTSSHYEPHAQVFQVSPQPWLRTGPGIALDGKPKFNLKEFNPEYFNRLKNRVKAADKRNIYVSIMLFEGWGLQFSPDGYTSHPFHPSNNVNQTMPENLPDSLKISIQDLKYDEVTRLQEAYVRKVIETVGDFDNVLYEISNEAHGGSTQWQYHMIRHIKELESKRGKIHPVGMTYQYKGGRNSTLFESPADWISPNSTDEENFKSDPPSDNHGKVIISDTDHLWGIGGHRQWVWKSFLRGNNPIFMDPYNGKILAKGAGSDWAEEIRVAMGYTVKFARKIDLLNSFPNENITSSDYCLANDGKEYLIYIPEHKGVEIDLNNVSGTYSVEWFNSVTGESSFGDDVVGNQKLNLDSPFEESEAVVLLKIR